MTVAEGTPKAGSIGVKFNVDIGEDISAATTKELHFVKPNGTIIKVEGTVENSQYLTYTTTADDDGDGNTLLDQVGGWNVVPYIIKTDFTGYGETCRFFVDGEY